MGTFEFSILMISVLFGLAAIVMWLDDDAMHKAEHDDLFHEHAHN
jgi:hypothetical protein